MIHLLKCLLIAIKFILCVLISGLYVVVIYIPTFLLGLMPLSYLKQTDPFLYSLWEWITKPNMLD